MKGRSVVKYIFCLSNITTFNAHMYIFDKQRQEGELFHMALEGISTVDNRIDFITISKLSSLVPLVRIFLLK